VSYQVIVPKPVQKQLDGLPDSVRERVIRRIAALKEKPALASPDLDCQMAWSDEWESKVDWHGSDFEETLEVLGIFCRVCGQVVIT